MRGPKQARHDIIRKGDAQGNLEKHGNDNIIDAWNL